VFGGLSSIVSSGIGIRRLQDDCLRIAARSDLRASCHVSSGTIIANYECLLPVQILGMLNSEEKRLFVDRIRYLDKKISPGLNKVRFGAGVREDNAISSSKASAVTKLERTYFSNSWNGIGEVSGRWGYHSFRIGRSPPLGGEPRLDPLQGCGDGGKRGLRVFGF
jgi:hypothetical protein